MTAPLIVQALGMAAVSISGLWCLAVVVQAVDQWWLKAFPPKRKHVWPMGKVG